MIHVSSPLRVPETYSLLGDPLYPTPIKLWLPKDPAEYEAKLRELHENREKAASEWRESPEDPEKLLWFARRTEIVGNFNEACAAYTEGIRRWPNDPRFPRFRGHRFALLRRLDLALEDLERASRLIEGRPDEPEIYASGGPNSDKLGFSSFHWNVWYHLGFARFATGDLEGAVEAYRRCMGVCDVRESFVATMHWLYMPLIRLKRWGEAAKLLEGIEPTEKLVEVGDYYETLFMYKGATTPEALLKKARSEGKVRLMTRAHAVGNLYLACDELRKAENVFKEIYETGEWSAGVHLLAEAELRRLGVKC
jgi:tetratricopeptide (TPR) repeat protein